MIRRIAFLSGLLLCGGLHAEPPKPDIAHLQALADRGDLRAKADLGGDYISGIGVASDPPRGFALVKEAAEKGFSRAEYNLGYFYRDGKGVAADPAQAFFWYKKAAEDGYANAQHYLGVILMDGLLGQPKDPVQAHAWYLQAARQKMPNDCTEMAWICRKGVGGAVDLAAAFCWARQAAEGGNAVGAYNVALAYSRGEAGIRRDDAMAWAWTEVAARFQFDNAAYRGANADLQRQLLDRLDPETVGDATRAAALYYQTLREGGYALSPNPGAPVEFIRAATADANRFETQGERDHSITIPVLIRGQGPFFFVLDTGAPCCVIDGKLADRLGLPQVASQAGFQDAPAIGRVVAGDYEIFGNKVRNGWFAVLPMQTISHASGREIAGLIGYDFLSRFTVEIDPLSHTVTLADPKAYQPGPAAQALPFTLSYGSALLANTFSGRDGEPISLKLAIDTGGGGGVILNKAFDREYSFTSLVPKAYPTEAVDMTGRDSAVVGRLASLSFGPFRIPGPIGEWEEAFAPVSEPAGVIGDEVWKCFRMAVDYQDRKLYLEPNALYGKTDEESWSGLSALYEGDDLAAVRVVKVSPDSPAAAAGFQEGDVLIAVDGETAKPALRDILRKPLEHAVTIRRGQETLELALKPEAF